MKLPENAFTQFTPDLRICRLLTGLWQVSGAHGSIDPHKAIDDMLAYHNEGFITWDLADHYGPAEDFIGLLRHRLLNERGEDAVNRVQAFTKWVPRPGRMNRMIVEEAINISLRRMNVERLDLLQFHWWDYQNPAYLDALHHMMDLQKESKIRHVALTNFDTEHLEIIVRNGINIVSNQVQYSLIDRRPEIKMAALCQKHSIKLLTYGTYCGGLLSESYLGAPEPTVNMLTTASLRKYKNMIEAWGGWDLFQDLLRTLKAIADKHGVSIPNVAVRAILDKPTVAGVIVGARLGQSEHRTDNVRVFNFELDSNDLAQIETVTQQQHNSFKVIGDCGDEYRR
ncbi:MAG: aldo/keto reductase [Anaerolineae bacterium]